jgi:hypothetical protein
LVVVLAAIVVLSLGPTRHVTGTTTSVPLPWQLVQRLPVMDNALPNRLAVYVDLCAAVLVAVGIDELRRRRWGLRLAGGATIALVALSWVPAAAYTTTVGQPAYFNDGGAVHEVPAGSLAVVLPYVEGPGTEHAELWQARAGFPFTRPEGFLIVPGPHYGPQTPTYEAFAHLAAHPAPLSEPLAAAVRQQWADSGVRTVVVGPGRYDQREVAALVSQVLDGAQPRWTGGVAVFTVPVPPASPGTLASAAGRTTDDG